MEMKSEKREGKKVKYMENSKEFSNFSYVSHNM